MHLFPHWNWPGLEGKEIAVWVYSNLDKVELLVNGQSLGMKEMKKDSHLAWNVKYAPGLIEARGFRADKLAMTAKRETTGAAAKLVMNADRREVNADGEDVTMFAVEVQDAQGRVVPITDNLVTFSVSGKGKLIGVGNGDPTDQESDKGTSRKAFSGLCMALIQSLKTAGSITVEATSPGLAPASVTIASKAVTLRPQVAVWAREVPAGSGLTGLWRPSPGAGAVSGLMAFLVGDGTTVYSLRQDGSNLTGSVEGIGGGFFGGSDAPIPITEGKVDGNSVSFKAANSTYTGTLKDGQLELLRKIEFGRWLPRVSEEPAGSRPAVGPPPDGSDPSFNLPAHLPPGIPIVLHRSSLGVRPRSAARNLQRAGEAGYPLHLVAAAPGLEAVRQPLAGSRVGVAGGAHLDGGGAGQQEFDRIFRSGDAAHADDGNVDGAGGLVDHAQGDGLDGRAGESAGDVAQARLAGFRIDGHGQEGIHQADRVGAGVGGDLGHVGDGGHVGRELDDERPRGGGPGPADQVFERARIGAEGHAAGVDVGAGDVQLVGRDALGLVEPLDDPDVLAHRVAEDVDDDLAEGIAPERRQLALDVTPRRLRSAGRWR